MFHASRSLPHNVLRAACRAARSSHSASTFGFSFDIDGVLVRGPRALPGASAALARLNAARVPWLLVTNGGGELESAKAAALSSTLGLPISPSQVVLSHTPLRAAVARHATEKILVLGCRDALGVARSYGATRAYSAEDVARDDPSRYPFLKWHAAPMPDREEPWGAVFVLHDPNSWAVELQVALDVLRGGAPLGAGSAAALGQQACPLYTSNSDLTFAGSYPVPRLAAGAFSRCLELLWRDVYGGELIATRCGKPTRMTADFARAALTAWAGRPLATVYHIGDNPAADVRLVHNAGAPWRSLLVRTGIFTGEGNDSDHPADHVFDNVGDAVGAVLKGAV